MGNNNALLRWLPFIALSIFALTVTPVKSGFEFSLKGCGIVPHGEQLSAAFTNYRHLVSYFVLFLSAAFAFGRSRLRAAAIATFALTLLVEFEQAIMMDGHCRTWDLIPNAIAIMAGLLVSAAVAFIWRKLESKSPG